ncbi:hypothetical protein [Rhodopseudomonas sp.]|uniref:hypothetical protein n=1 Tax=Rhodopseudomonas sp. TaxID=1078 RepID=UPI0039E455A0
MLSGYPSELFDRELAAWRRIEFDAPTHAGTATEVVWMNYEPPLVLHDHAHVGRGFRKREAIKRRRARLISRIRGLPNRERGALFAELASAEPDLYRAALASTKIRVDASRENPR